MEETAAKRVPRPPLAAARAQGVHEVGQPAARAGLARVARVRAGREQRLERPADALEQTTATAVSASLQQAPAGPSPHTEAKPVEADSTGTSSNDP